MCLVHLRLRYASNSKNTLSKWSVSLHLCRSAVKSGDTNITGTIANVSPNMLHLMTSYGQARDGQLGPDDRKVWEALVASSAAPTFPYPMLLLFYILTNLV